MRDFSCENFWSNFEYPVMTYIDVDSYFCQPC